MRTELFAIDEDNRFIKDVGTVEYFTVKEVLAGDVRQIGDEFILVNDNIPVKCLLQVIVPEKDEKRNVLSSITEHPDVQRLIIQTELLQNKGGK